MNCPWCKTKMEIPDWDPDVEEYVVYYECPLCKGGTEVYYYPPETGLWEEEEEE